MQDAYKYLGCQYHAEQASAVFRVFAPHAIGVSVLGDFNGWDKSAHPLKRITDAGIWEVHMNGVQVFDAYKFCVRTARKEIFKSDPYAFHSETGAFTNSKVYSLDHFVWQDEAYMAARAQRDIYRSPVNIYEAQISSWKRSADGSLLDYRSFADKIIPYLKKMHYTHLELIGLSEYPFDRSWGYQVTGYYAPTSRHGTPDGLVYLIDRLHQNGIGLIVDWVPGHFPKNENGLYEFDGQPLYEPEDPYRREHKEWGTRTFDYGRPEVLSFLVSNAMMWFDVYHVDGLRVDAVASILYLDYGRETGEWKPNIYGGNGNLEAIRFFQKLNTEVFGRFSGIMMIAEESTAWPNITKPVELGGLGFNFKWNMGWMNDNLEYLKADPFFRKDLHGKLTFSLTYAFSENFILPISHDEVVHGKCALIAKIPGNYEEKFAGFRNFLMSMYSHPGKKLLFMGTELAAFDEWDFSKELFWDILDYPKHLEAWDFVKKLNAVYYRYPAFWQIDDGWQGFRWIIVDDCGANVIAYERIDQAGNRMLCIFNFSPITRTHYRFGIGKGSYRQVLSSDLGGVSCEPVRLRTESKPCGGYKNSLVMDIKGLSGTYLYHRAGRRKGGSKE